MPIAHFVDFLQTGRGGSLRPGGWSARREFYIPLFDAMNRQNEQPTTVNFIFSSS